MFTNPLYVAAVLGLGFLCWLLLRALGPLRSIPGPFLARFSDVWYFWQVSRGHFEKVNLTLHAEYGPIVRYGPNRYRVNNPQAAKIIYGHASKFSKSSWYSTWGAPTRRDH
ncbi:hypothetical protein BX600DRAFT_516939 [Xylariales sp. PMI_506]|nr:hypothetical protein BX600DRAFT_516939 [Xylariales sp. PMI_506]